MWRGVARVLLSTEGALIEFACEVSDLSRVEDAPPRREHLKIRVAGRLARISSHDTAEFWRELENVK